MNRITLSVSYFLIIFAFLSTTFFEKGLINKPKRDIAQFESLKNCILSMLDLTGFKLSQRNKRFIYDQLRSDFGTLLENNHYNGTSIFHLDFEEFFTKIEIKIPKISRKDLIEFINSKEAYRADQNDIREIPYDEQPSVLAKKITDRIDEIISNKVLSKRKRKQKILLILRLAFDTLKEDQIHNYHNITKIDFSSFLQKLQIDGFLTNHYELIEIINKSKNYQLVYNKIGKPMEIEETPVDIKNYKPPGIENIVKRNSNLNRDQTQSIVLGYLKDKFLPNDQIQEPVSELIISSFIQELQEQGYRINERELIDLISNNESFKLTYDNSNNPFKIEYVPVSERATFIANKKARLDQQVRINSALTIKEQQEKSLRYIHTFFDFEYQSELIHIYMKEGVLLDLAYDHLNEVGLVKSLDELEQLIKDSDRYEISENINGNKVIKLK